jgi:hypothetical protein
LGGNLPIRAAEPLFQSEFPKQGLSGWAQTKDMTAKATDTGLDLSSTGWDAKLYRSIELPPGRYAIYGRGQGRLRILVLSDWKTPPVGILNLSGEKTFTDYRDFEIPKGSPQKSILAIWVSTKESKASLEWLRVESSPGVPTPTAAIPSPEELAREHPAPAMVRGFMTDSFNGVTGEMMSEIKQWGANVIRLQLNPVKRQGKRI